MPKDNFNKLGLAALVLLAPGGFILGAALAARYYRRKAEQQARTEHAPDDTVETAGPP